MAWPAAIAGGASIIGGLLGGAGSAKAASKAWSRQKRLIRYTPKLQMRGFREAGLNPILAAGAGVHSGGGNLPPQQIDPGAFGRGVSSAFQAALEAKQLRAATVNTEANTAKATAEADEAYARTGESYARTGLHNLQEAEIAARLPHVSSKIKKEIEELTSRVAYNSAKAAAAHATIPRLKFESSLPGFLLQNLPDAIRAGAHSAAALKMSGALRRRP